MDDKLTDAVRFLLNQTVTYGNGPQVQAARQHLANLAAPAVSEIPAAQRVPREEPVDPD